MEKKPETNYEDMLELVARFDISEWKRALVASEERFFAFGIENIFEDMKYT